MSASWIVGKRAETKVQEIDEVTLSFFARDGKAMAAYKSPDTEMEVQVNSWEHAIKLAAKAVANANTLEIPFHVFDGEENDADPFANNINTCLSTAAWSAVKAEEKKATANGLFEASW